MTAIAWASPSGWASPSHWPGLLCQRGVTLAEAEGYLQPTLRDLLPDPHHLLDMRKAAARFAAAIMAGQIIGVFGDYDVDGATSSALILRFCRSLGIATALHIPDRQKEGYGPNITGLRKLHAQGARLIITVDTGTLAFAPLAEATAEGMEILVIDHHQGEPTLPDAHAVVNPNRFDETSAHGHLAAVGVTFLLLVATNAALREAGHFTNRPTPDLRHLLDIVALGTVCDVVPLVGLNRAFVLQGLKIMRQRNNAGLAALMDVSRLDQPPGVYHLGYLLGPRINAGGRVGQSDLGTRLLTTEDPDEARHIAEQLEQYNKERKAIEAQVQEQASLQAESQRNAPFILVAGDGWHEGVIGIVAGRLKEAHNRPAAVVSFNAQGIGKASARSVKGVDLGQAVIAARQAGLLVAGGGHAMAAGFTVQREKFEDFTAFLTAQLEKAVAAHALQDALHLDAELALSAATLEMAALLEQAGPYGAGNPAHASGSKTSCSSRWIA